jgi:hypothetical protein
MRHCLRRSRAERELDERCSSTMRRRNLRSVIRKALLSSAGGLLLLGVAGFVAARAGSSASRVVPPAVTVRCAPAPLHFKTGNEIGEGYRVVLGLVSAPPVYLPGVGRDPSSAPFTHWLKAGLGVRATDAVVKVAVPKAWRDRVRITWGSASSSGTELRFAPCPSAVETWNGYPGGFLLRSSSACVPLIFTVGNRRATLRFGVGTHCP